MAVNLTIANSASGKEDAIALGTYANQLTFYRCSIKGYMYTLSTIWGEQFFRDCDIYGTTSLISGAAAAVFQNCNIITLEPSPGQKIVFFLQTRKAAKGDGFIAHDIWIQNTAGPAKGQVVALRVGADTSVINRCKLDAYQDTPYTHSLRQFYKNSSITGTGDFIFGNAAIVFQNCKIIARKPMSWQGNMLTAQGRTDPNQNTGTSIQKCQVIPSTDLIPVEGSVKTYLGRAWKEYSRTVFMKSSIDNHIDPKGWSAWSGDFALKTLYYGEYANSGPGTGTSNRVNWPGYYVITNPNDAHKFTVGELIQGGQWLKATGAAYTEGL